MRNQTSAAAYRYESAANSNSHAYLLPTVNEELISIKQRICLTPPGLFDLGCGNGSVGATFRPGSAARMTMGNPKK